ncbi:MAG: hypothetical protein L0170_05430 [Acidobacteria bacterium]|nr:hypothetical protein [Acidobacteriota bacterium]
MTQLTEDELDFLLVLLVTHAKGHPLKESIHTKLDMMAWCLEDETT